MQVLSLEIKELWELVGQAVVYGFVNDRDKKVQVFSTIDLLGHVTRVIKELGSTYQGLREDVQDEVVKVVILEKVEDLEYMRLRQRQWMSSYESQGYKFYKESNPVNYVLHRSIRRYWKHTYYFVSLENTRRSKEIVVGLFKTKALADSFISKYYTPVISDVVYANNSETKKFLKQEVDYFNN